MYITCHARGLQHATFLVAIAMPILPSAHDILDVAVQRSHQERMSTLAPPGRFLKFGIFP